MADGTMARGATRLWRCRRRGRRPRGPRGSAGATVRLAVVALAAAPALPGWMPGAAPEAALLAQDDLSAAREQVRTGAWDEALATYDRLARGARPEVLRERARLQMDLGMYDRALDGVTGAGGQAATDALANTRGEALAALGRYDEAEAAFRRAAAADVPDRHVARKNLAVLLWNRGERDEARELFDGFFDLYNRGGSLSAEDLMAVGTAVRHLGAENPALFQDALLAFDQAAEADPADPRPHVLAGTLFLDTYNAPDAHASFDQVLGTNPRHPDALLGKARVLEFDGDGRAALERVRQALEVNPRHVEARAFLARLHLVAEEHDRARNEAEEALETNPRHLGALSVLGAAHLLAGDTAEWEAVRDRVNEVNRSYPDLWVTVAEMAAQQRRYHDAVELAGRALALDSTSWSALGVLGMNQLRTGAIEAGRRSLTRAFEGDPYNVPYKNTLDLLDTFRHYETIRTEHTELFIHGREAELLGPYAEALAEEAFNALAARYGATPPTPVRIEIFPSHADFSVRSLGQVGLGALGIAFGSVLVMDSPSARERGDFNWQSVLWHEMAHAFHLGMTDHRVPRWFSEGLAVHEQRTAREGWGHAPSPGWLRAYRDGRMPPVSELNRAFVRPEYPEQVGHAYYQASLVFRMIEERHGFQPVLGMLQAYRDGRDTDGAVRQALGMEPEELDEAFDTWVRERFGRQMEAVAAVEDGSSAAGTPAGGRGLPSGPGGPGGDLAELRRAAAARPNSFPLRLALGAALKEAGELDDAQLELQAALGLFPEYAGSDGPLRHLAGIHRERGETERAAATLHRLGRLNETLWQAHAEEAELRLELGDTAAAAAALERAVEVVPGQVELHRRLAEAYAAVGDHVGEIRERRALLALGPADRADAHYRLARAHHRAGDRDAARRELLRALEIAPSFDAALELLLEVRGGGS